MNADPTAKPPAIAYAALALVGLCWVLPFLSPNFQEPIGSFYGEMAAIVLGLLAVSCLLARSLWAGLVVPRASLVFLGFIGIILLHWAIGRLAYPQLNLVAALYLLWALALAMLGRRLREIFGEERMVTVLCWFLLAGALVSAAIGLCQVLGIRSPLSPYMLPQLHDRIYANTGQPNHLAGYLCIGLASICYLRATRRLDLVPAVAAMLPLLIVLTLSGSRSPWLYLPALTLLAVAFHLAIRNTETGRLWKASLMVLAGYFVTLLVVGMIATDGNSLGTVQQRIADQGMGSSVRMRAWHEAWLMFADSPLVGAGYRMFAWHQFLLNAQLPPPRLDEGVVDNAHNLVMHTLAEFGLAGLAVLLGGALAWLLALRHETALTALWWMVTVAAILSIHSMLEYPLWYAYFLGIAAVGLGMSDRRVLTIGDLGRGRLVLMAALLLGWVALGNLYQDYRTLQALHRIERSAKAEGGRPRNTADELLQLQQHSLFAPFVELALSRLMVLDQNQIGDKVEFNDAVMHFTPAPDVTYRQAILLALAGNARAAHLQWDLARKNFPREAARSLQLMRELPRGDGLAELIGYAEAGGDGAP